MFKISKFSNNYKEEEEEDYYFGAIYISKVFLLMLNFEKDEKTYLNTTAKNFFK